MATLARLTPQTVKLIYHQAQEFAPHKEHVISQEPPDKPETREAYP